MFILFNKNIFLIILISILFASGLDEQQSKNDGMCSIRRGVLCVKDVLMIIATVAKSLNRTANEIEKHIVQKIGILDTLNRYVNFEMGLIHSNLPTPQYHVQFFLFNNIDKVFFSSIFFYLNNIFFIEIFR
jgi:hypothetical protein